MELPTKTINQIQQALDGAKTDPQDARPILMPDFRISVTIPQIVQPVNNIPANIQVTSFVFGGIRSRNNAAATSETLAVLGKGLWKIELNVGFYAIAPATAGTDSYSLTLGATRHLFVIIQRLALDAGGGSGTHIEFNNSLTV